MEDSSSIFKERLNAAMKAKGYSNAALARETHLSAAAIGNYVKGRMPRGCDEIVRLARTLDTTPDYLLGFSDDKMPQKVEKFKIENYADALHAIDSLTNCFQSEVKAIHHKAESTGYDPYNEIEVFSDPYDELVITIRDSAICEFNRKRNKLINALGDIIKIERYNLLYDDLTEEMKQTKVEKQWDDLPLPF